MSGRPSPLDSVVADVAAGRAHLVTALDALKARRDSNKQVDTLTQVVGELYGLLADWELERARWVA